MDSASLKARGRLGSNFPLSMALIACRETSYLMSQFFLGPTVCCTEDFKPTFHRYFAAIRNLPISMEASMMMKAINQFAGIG